MVKRNLKGGMSDFNQNDQNNSSCAGYKTCNLSDAKYSTDVYKGRVDYTSLDSSKSDSFFNMPVTGGSKNFSKKEEKSLNKLFFKLLENSYINYLEHNRSSYSKKSKKGGSIENTFNSTFNITDLMNTNPFQLKPVENISSVPQSNFAAVSF